MTSLIQHEKTTAKKTACSNPGRLRYGLTVMRLIYQADNVRSWGDVFIWLPSGHDMNCKKIKMCVLLSVCSCLLVQIEWHKQCLAEGKSLPPTAGILPCSGTNRCSKGSSYNIKYKYKGWRHRWLIFENKTWEIIWLFQIFYSRGAKLISY